MGGNRLRDVIKNSLCAAKLNFFLQIWAMLAIDSLLLFPWKETSVILAKFDEKQINSFS